MTPQRVVITADEARLQSGNQVVARVRTGQRLTVTQTQGEWYQVRTTGNGRNVQGWIQRQFVQFDTTSTPAKSKSNEKDRRLAEADALDQKLVQLVKKGMHQDGIPLAKQVLSPREKALGANHRNLAQSLDNLGFLYRTIDDNSAARPSRPAISTRQASGRIP